MSTTTHEIPEELENRAFAVARRAQTEAAPLQQAPWLGRLVGRVVDETLGLAAEHYATPAPAPEIKPPTISRAELGFELYDALKGANTREKNRADWDNDSSTHFIGYVLADRAIAVIKGASRP